jgi:hypothetical protein
MELFPELSLKLRIRIRNNGIKDPDPGVQKITDPPDPDPHFFGQRRWNESQ